MNVSDTSIQMFTHALLSAASCMKKTVTVGSSPEHRSPWFDAERERERERQTDRQTDRQRPKETETETERHRDRERRRQRQTDRQRQRDRERPKETETETERQRQRETETETERLREQPAQRAVTESRGQCLVVRSNSATDPVGVVHVLAMTWLYQSDSICVTVRWSAHWD